MALGNANTSAQARGKNIAVKSKRRREIVIAKDYNSFLGSALATEQRDACALRDVNVRYYHNSSNPMPRAGDIIYQQKRARANNRFGPGYIQFQDRGRGFTIEINERGMVVGAILAC